MKEERFSRESAITNMVFHTKAWFSTSSPKGRCHLQVLQRGITQWWIQHLIIEVHEKSYLFNFSIFFFLFFRRIFWFCNIYGRVARILIRSNVKPQQIRSLKGSEIFWLLFQITHVQKRLLTYTGICILLFSARLFFYVQFVVQLVYGQ